MDLRRLAAALLTAVAAVDLVGVVRDVRDLASAVTTVAVVVATLLSAVVGFVVARRQSQNPIGWLLLTHGLLVAAVVQDYDPATGTAAAVAAQLGEGGWVLLYVCLVVVVQLFPDGRTASPRWRRFLIVCLAGYATFFVAATLDDGSFRHQYPGVEPPLPGLPGSLGGILGAPGLVLVAASLVGSVVVARQRLRRARGEQRLQMLWLVESAVTVPGALLVCWLDHWLTGTAGTLTVVAILVMGTAVPLGIGVGVLRHRLFDIELVLSRTLTYGGLTAGAVVLYAGVVALADRVTGEQTAGLVAVGVVSVGLLPAHAWLRRRVERAVYGDRSDPIAALRRLSERVDAVADPRAVVDAVTSCVAEALRVPAVHVVLRADADGVPLVHRGERVGSLVVDVPPGRPLTDADRRMLADLAAASAPVVHAVHLTLELQQSRARLVAAQAEERLRLRRDLHDGLGPSLAALLLKLDAARRATAEPAARAVVDELKDDVRSAIAEVRRVVEGLRPPALDEVGLVASLRQRAEALSRGEVLVVTVDGPAGVLHLPPAVEVAAYRIATEAMTNVVRHAAASRCTVEVTANGALQVQVADNGSGPAEWAVPGVGWTSMQERAAELGGSCTVSARPEGGTTVRAVLPLPAPDRQPA